MITFVPTLFVCYQMLELLGLRFHFQSLAFVIHPLLLRVMLD